jgi:hypothetical protein
MAGMLLLLLGGPSTAMPGTLTEGTEPRGLLCVSSTQIDGICAVVGARGIGALSAATTILGIAMGFSGCANEEEDLLGAAGSAR